MCIYACELSRYIFIKKKIRIHIKKNTYTYEKKTDTYEQIREHMKKYVYI